MTIATSQAKTFQVLEPEKWRTGTVFIVGVLVGTAVTTSLLSLGGRLDGALAIGLVFGLGIGIVAHPLYGYYLLLATVILADDWMLYFSPWTHYFLGYYAFQNWWKLLSPEGVRNFGFLFTNTIEILFVALVAGLTLRTIRGGNRLVVPREFAFAFLYLAILIGMLVYGLATGGALKPALWQSRYLFHFVTVALLTPQVLRTPAHIRGALWALMIPTVFKALQILWIFFVEEGAHFGDWRQILGHEDANFLVGAIVLAVVLTLYRAEPFQRWFLLTTLPLILLALVVNLGRAGYVSLAVSFGLLPSLLENRRRFVLKLAVPVLVFLAAYSAFFWNRADDPVGVPLQKVKSIFFIAPVGTADYNSNLYRVAENYNLQHTILNHPWGLGFGHPFNSYLPLPDISLLLAQWQYRPHNTILGMWMFLGTPGFIVCLAYFGSIIMLASRHVRQQSDPYFKAVSFFILAAFTSGLLFATVDHYIGIQRGAVFLGALAGILSVLERLRPASPLLRSESTMETLVAEIS